MFRATLVYLHLCCVLRAALICAEHNQSRKRLMIKLFCPLFWIRSISPLGDWKQLRGVAETQRQVSCQWEEKKFVEERKKREKNVLGQRKKYNWMIYNFFLFTFKYTGCIQNIFWKHNLNNTNNDLEYTWNKAHCFRHTLWTLKTSILGKKHVKCCC